MTYENKTGLGVSNHYGPRKTGDTVGVLKKDGRYVELSIDLTPEMVAASGVLLTDFTIPAGSDVEDVYVRVSEAFTLGGTSPTILVGTSGSEDTNGLVISKVEAEATGAYDVTPTLTGTWTSPLAADTVVSAVLGGTNPTAALGKGAARVVIRYTTMA